MCPPGGVPRQAEESADRRGSSVVPGSLQPAQPAAEGEAEGAGELVRTLLLLTLTLTLTRQRPHPIRGRLVAHSSAGDSACSTTRVRTQKNFKFHCMAAFLNQWGATQKWVAQLFSIHFNHFNDLLSQNEGKWGQCFTVVD